MIKFLRNLFCIKINTWILYAYARLFNSNIILDRKITFRKRPLINISNNSKISIGENVVLNSMNRGYHINMFAPVKLFADGIHSEIHIGKNTRIHGSCIHAQNYISIGSNCLIAGNSQIFDNNGHDSSQNNPKNRINTTGRAKSVIIEDNVWIGAHSIILPGVIIGEGSIITAGSVVHTNIPKFCFAGGNPALVIKNFKVEN
jgi:acetyltransferase-like isoleucine patch superfamily enzyme